MNLLAPVYPGRMRRRVCGSAQGPRKGPERMIIGSDMPYADGNDVPPAMTGGRPRC